MLKNDLMLRNPLRILGQAGGAPLPRGGFGAVLARAGVGKTAFLVQLALDSLLRGERVLHISLHDPVQKVDLWYREVLANVAARQAVRDIAPLWEAVVPNRMIMTFRVGGFSVPKLEERVTDLTDQGIFQPRMVLFDGLPFEAETTPPLMADLKALADRLGVHAWFAVRTHRHEPPAEDGLPAPLRGIGHLFEALLQLLPEADSVHVHALRGGPQGAGELPLRLDPGTMLVCDNQ